MNCNTHTQHEPDELATDALMACVKWNVFTLLSCHGSVFDILPFPLTGLYFGCSGALGLSLLSITSTVNPHLKGIRTWLNAYLLMSFLADWVSSFYSA